MYILYQINYENPELLERGEKDERENSDDIFKELGFQKYDYLEHNDYYYETTEKVISFRKNKTVAAFNINDGFEFITMKELQAINKKCEELRLVMKKGQIMTVRDFLKEILDKKTRKKKIEVRYESCRYTFYAEDFKFIKYNGTGLVIGRVLDEEIEVL